MCKRKSWTKQEDSILKSLYQEKRSKKWSELAEIMRTQYGISGRNGKQCRQRYHNHLDQKISKVEWTTQEDEKLLSLHNKYGNRWALIARQIKGRTDNTVKNRFYSRFRRSIKNVNGFIKIFWKGQFKQLKLALISKIIQITQVYRNSKNQQKKQNFLASESNFQLTEGIKNRLMSFSDYTENQLKQNLLVYNNLLTLIEQISLFNKNVKKSNKRKKRTISQVQEQSIQFDWDQNKQKIKYDKKKQKKYKITQLQNLKMQNKFVNVNNLQKETVQLVLNLKDQNYIQKQGLVLQKFDQNKIKDEKNQTKLIIQQIQPAFKQDHPIMYQKYEQICQNIIEGINIDQFFKEIQCQGTYYYGIDKLV